MEYKNYKLPRTYKLGSEGVASFLEPPNHPRHFTQSIYTQHGNAPSRGPQYYFKGSGFDSIEEVDKHFKPLPYNHPRVKAWERYAYAYFRNSYSPDGKTRDVSKAIIAKTVTEQPSKHHLAYLLVKEYYPQAKPRLDLIRKPPKWGKTGDWWKKGENKGQTKLPKGVRYV